MRFVVYGLGGIGGVLAARLQLAGHEVVGVARGEQLTAVQLGGLRLETPTTSVTVDLPVVAHPAHLAFRDDDVAVIAVKSQDTETVVRALAATAPPDLTVLCAQNGVANEPCALRCFPEVYGVVVMCPTVFLRPGAVRAHSAPTTGLLDVGRYPVGDDHVSRSIAEVFSSATYDARSISDVRRWKYTKLLTNLGNVVEAVCGPAGRSGPLTDLLRAEGEACLRAAGISYASAREDRDRRGSLLAVRAVAGETRPGGSTWQSLRRATGETEVDYLNGEIVLLGRLHGIAVPGNTLVQRLAADLARAGSPPGSMQAEDVLARIGGEH